MANQVIAPRPKPPVDKTNRRSESTHFAVISQAPKLSLLPEMHESMLHSLYVNLRDLLFPEKLPPLRLTSQPVPVREIWTRVNHKKSATGSLILHGIGLAALIVIPILLARNASVTKPTDSVKLVEPPLSDYQPVMQPKVAPKPLAGGGGGGEHAKVFESKGHLPKVAPQQFTPPTVEIKNMKPKL